MKSGSLIPYSLRPTDRSRFTLSDTFINTVPLLCTIFLLVSMYFCVLLLYTGADMDTNVVVYGKHALHP